MKSRALIGALALLTGCVASPPTPWEAAARWLSDAPRSIAIRVDRELPAPAVVTYDHRIGARIVVGAVSAAVGAAVAAIGNALRDCSGPYFDVCGTLVVVMAVVVGVIGFASVDSVEHAHAPETVPGSSALFTLGTGAMDVPALLAAAIAAHGKAGEHRLRALVAGEVVPDGEAVLQLRVTALQLDGEIGNDPAVALHLTVASDLRTPVLGELGRGAYSYIGSRRRISEWQANDSAAFRAEMAAALESIANDILADLRAAGAR